MFYALVADWFGNPCAVHKGNTARGPWARWERVSPEEYRDLLAEGFEVCISWAADQGQGGRDEQG
jgi:hypothetical protein